MSTSLLLPPNASKRPAGVVFIGLNVVRFISLVSLVLVVAATIAHMVGDLRAVDAWIKAGSPSSGLSSQDIDADDWECDVIENSSIPNQVGGPFFSVLSRIIVLFICVVLFLSELGGPRIVRKFFELFVPSLGPQHGLGTLGFVQMFIAATVLSGFVPLFLQVSGWFLFVIGCFNLALGFLGVEVKTWRQIFSFENLSTLTPQTSMAYSAYQAASDNSEKLAGLKSRFFPSAAGARPASAGYDDIEKEFARNPRVGKIPFVSFGGRAATASSKSAAPTPTQHGVEAAGFGGFGKQGERKAKLKGYLISKPQVGVTKP